MSYLQEFTGPRDIPEPKLGFDPLLIADAQHPCGQDICVPLGADCQENGVDPEQAVVACGRHMGNLVLLGRLASLRGERQTHVQLIRRLSIDPDTGILTRTAQTVLFENLETAGLLEQMRQQGYTFQFLFADLDKLRAHNDLGDHAGGDAAIAAAVTVMRKIHRREYDLVARAESLQDEPLPETSGVLEHHVQANDAVKETEIFDALSRFNKGDELLVMSFVPPPDRSRRRPIEATPDAQISRIVEAFAGLTVSYPINPSLTAEDIAHIREVNPTFEFTITGGTVCASVSLSFALVIDRVPVTLEEFNDVRHAADGVLNLIKKRRADIRTRGQVLNLL